MLTLCLLPRVLVIWTELMCSLRTKKEISKLWWAGRLTSCWSHLIKICMKLDTLQHWVVLFVLNCTESYWIPPGSLSALIGNLWETPVCNWFPFNSPRANLDKLFLYTSKSLRLSVSLPPSLSLTHTHCTSTTETILTLEDDSVFLATCEEPWCAADLFFHWATSTKEGMKGNLRVCKHCQSCKKTLCSRS